MRFTLLALAILPLALLVPTPAGAAGCLSGTVGAGPITLAAYQVANPLGPPGPSICTVGLTVYRCDTALYPVTYVRCEPWIVLP